MKIRHIHSNDYVHISPLLNDWWGGRQMADMLPKLFFEHFTETSFIAEKEGEITGFLIGFLSQTHRDEAYIHFVGVHPNHRGERIGEKLYETFFACVKEQDRKVVRSVTSPVNKGSIAFHTKMGFKIEPGDKVKDGVSIHSNYDGKNEDRVRFMCLID